MKPTSKASDYKTVRKSKREMWTGILKRRHNCDAENENRPTGKSVIEDEAGGCS